MPRKGPRPVPLAERFWRYVSPEPNTGCWLWTGAEDGHGYGVLGLDGKRVEKAHRIAWLIGCGEIPSGGHVLHRCDTPACVNYERDLYIGTHADNMRDKVKRNRNPQHMRPGFFAGDRHWTKRRRHDPEGWP
jgi:hypothetical protein